MSNGVPFFDECSLVFDFTQSLRFPACANCTHISSQGWLLGPACHRRHQAILQERVRTPASHPPIPQSRSRSRIRSLARVTHEFEYKSQRAVCTLRSCVGICCRNSVRYLHHIRGVRLFFSAHHLILLWKARSLILECCCRTRSLILKGAQEPAFGRVCVKTRSD